jgi:DNA-binding PadR family transcriptional regulator
MKSAMFGLTAFQRDLLYVIMGSDKPSGQEIRRRLENDTSIAKVNNGRLYLNLDSLVDSGLVEKGDRDQSTNYYDLTDAGRDTIENRREWEAEMLGGRP